MNITLGLPWLLHVFSVSLVDLSPGNDLLEVSLKNAVLPGVVSHQSLPVFAFHIAGAILTPRANEGPPSGQGSLDTLLNNKRVLC